MIWYCRFYVIQYLLYPDGNTQCQPFYQPFHHEIQDRSFVETDSCFSNKMEEYTMSYSYISIVYMQELPLPA